MASSLHTSAHHPREMGQQLQQMDQPPFEPLQVPEPTVLLATAAAASPGGDSMCGDMGDLDLSFLDHCDDADADDGQQEVPPEITMSTTSAKPSEPVPVPMEPSTPAPAPQATFAATPTPAHMTAATPSHHPPAAQPPLPHVPNMTHLFAMAQAAAAAASAAAGAAANTAHKPRAPPPVLPQQMAAFYAAAAAAAATGGNPFLASVMQQHQNAFLFQQQRALYASMAAAAAAAAAGGAGGGSPQAAAALAMHRLMQPIPAYHRHAMMAAAAAAMAAAHNARQAAAAATTTTDAATGTTPHSTIEQQQQQQQQQQQPSADAAIKAEGPASPAASSEVPVALATSHASCFTVGTDAATATTTTATTLPPTAATAPTTAPVAARRALSTSPLLLNLDLGLDAEMTPAPNHSEPLVLDAASAQAAALQPPPAAPLTPICLPPAGATGTSSGVTSVYDDSSSTTRGGYIGAYSPRSRKARIERFHAKRLQRCWIKRKRKVTQTGFWNRMVRVRGRFVRKCSPPPPEASVPVAAPGQQGVVKVEVQRVEEVEFLCMDEEEGEEGSVGGAGMELVSLVGEEEEEEAESDAEAEAEEDDEEEIEEQQEQEGGCSIEVVAHAPPCPVDVGCGGTAALPPHFPAACVVVQAHAHDVFAGVVEDDVLQLPGPVDEAFPALTFDDVAF